MIFLNASNKPYLLVILFIIDFLRICAEYRYRSGRSRLRALAPYSRLKATYEFGRYRYWLSLKKEKGGKFFITSFVRVGLSNTKKNIAKIPGMHLCTCQAKICIFVLTKRKYRYASLYLPSENMHLWHLPGKNMHLFTCQAKICIYVLAKGKYVGIFVPVLAKQKYASLYLPSENSWNILISCPKKVTQKLEKH